MNIEQAVDQTIALCRRFEGFSARPYLCPAGVPTIGYGATHYESGRKVSLFDSPITLERGEALLRWMILNEYMPAVISLCPAINDERLLAAITDFTFNLGVARLKGSTLRRRINAGALSEVPTQLMRWNKVGGVALRGLTRRRAAECSLLAPS